MKYRNFCTHCNLSGHWTNKCWKLHLELGPKKDKQVMQVHEHHEVNKKEQHAINIHEAEDQPKEEGLLTWLSKKWISYLEC